MTSRTTGRRKAWGKGRRSRRATLVLALSVTGLTSLPGAAFGVAGDFAHAPTSPEGAGAAPFHVAAGQLNGDANTDLVTASFGFTDVYVHLSNGGLGDFSPALLETVGDNPSAVAIANFAGDANNDIAVANSVGDEVNILVGDGMGGFTAVPTTTPVGNEPLNIIAANFDGDADMDLAVTHPLIDVVTILLGDGTGAFIASTEAAVDNPRAVTAANFNGGALDLAVATRESDDVQILIGDGTGNFTPKMTTSPEAAGDGPTSVEPANFDGDADVDLAVTNENLGAVTILLNDGTGDFTEKATTSPETVGAAPRKVVAANFGGDANIDLATANTGSDDVSILLGDGTGNFTAAPTSPEGSGNAPWWLVAANLNGDSLPDLAVVNELANTVSILLNDATAAPPTGGGGGPATPVTPAKKCKKKKKKK